jgi:hypothetical protein
VAVRHARDCGVGEGHDGSHHLSELAGQALFQTLLASPCFPALLADSAVPIQGVAERRKPRAAVACHLADWRAQAAPSIAWRLASAYMSAKSRQRVFAVPLMIAVTIFSA